MAVTESASETLERIQRLRALRDDFVGRLRGIQSHKPAMLLPHLFALPYVTVPMAKTLLDVTRSPTAQQAIDKLVAAGILELMSYRPKLGRGRPPKLYRCPAILEIIRE